MQRSKTKASKAVRDVTFSARCVLAGKHVESLQEWISQEIVQAAGRVRDNHILYAASRDGFSNEMFHKLCDGKAPTLTIVKLDDGHIFGGHTAVPWQSSGGPRSDPLAFLFSLTDGERRAPCFLSQFQHWGFSVHHARDRGPLFGHGAGADLGLDLDEERLLRSRSAVGQTFAIPRRSIREPPVSDTFLAGRLDGWHIDEVVVYQCLPHQRAALPLGFDEPHNRPASRAPYAGPPARPFLAEGVLRSLEAAAPGPPPLLVLIGHAASLTPY